ncbi:hypothetical protein QBC47DRAFT_154225 [Echria macrotheca]|uniref:Mucin-7 protein n=1 Tax=Echria macrotheca TaxID=438768 RepID=A0AAJ0BG25_9PEZI|nr:hypothetical protein QBC47DRAFT_154225 [Echria macrotheca]
MSAVKNLRAMFEQKGETTQTSPPDRGRSPGIPPSVGSESPRPLSKVRTNFIAIEKDGRIGLQRDPSQDSNVSATRKLSGDTDISTPPARSDPFVDIPTRTPAKTNILHQTIPESPRTDSAPETAVPPKPTEPPKDESSGRNPKKTAGDGVNGKATAGASNPAPVAKTQPVNGTASGKTKAKEIATVKEEASAKGKGKDAAKEDVAKPVAKTAAKSAPKPLAVPSAGKASTKSAKSPTVAKAPKSPAETSTTPRLPAKTPDRATRQPEKADTPATARGSSNPPRASSIKRPPALQPSPSSTGFVKPKVKSPTRPVKLPPSLTTHTAASGSKVNANRLSLSRSSGNLHAAESQGRSPSRTSVSTVATAAAKTTGTKVLKRQSSTVGRPRPSLGPPPKVVAKDHPVTKKEKDVDESFLARMMRPTAASASKVHDKVPTTPPRKPTIASTVKKQPVKADGKAIRKVASKPATAAGPSQVAESSTANQLAVEAEQTATAEEAIEVAKEIEGEVALGTDTGEQSTAQEVADAAEHMENADEAIEIAKAIEGESAVAEHAEEDARSTEENVDEVADNVKQLSLADQPSTDEPLPNGKHEQVDIEDKAAGEELDKEQVTAEVKEEDS